MSSRMIIDIVKFREVVWELMQTNSKSNTVISEMLLSMSISTLSDLILNFSNKDKEFLEIKELLDSTIRSMAGRNAAALKEPRISS